MAFNGNNFPWDAGGYLKPFLQDDSLLYSFCNNDEDEECDNMFIDMSELELYLSQIDHTDIHVATSLLDRYVKNNELNSAEAVLESLEYRSILAWNLMVFRYSSKGGSEKALKPVYQMKAMGVRQDFLTGYSWAGHTNEALDMMRQIKGCAGLSLLQKQKEVHFSITGNIYVEDAFVCTLIQMNSKCDYLDSAYNVFKATGNEALVVSFATWSSKSTLIFQLITSNLEDKIVLKTDGIVMQQNQRTWGLKGASKRWLKWIRVASLMRPKWSRMA